MIELKDRVSYEACSFDDIIHVWSPDGRLEGEISNLSPGEHFFGDKNYCATGMKIIVNVSSNPDASIEFTDLNAYRSREVQWKEHLQQEKASIKAEIEQYKDILVVNDLVDTYRWDTIALFQFRHKICTSIILNQNNLFHRNLASKVLAYHAWAVKQGVQYSMKIDDDTYVPSIPAILSSQ